MFNKQFQTKANTKTNIACYGDYSATYQSKNLYGQILNNSAIFSNESNYVFKNYNI